MCPYFKMGCVPILIILISIVPLVSDISSDIRSDIRGWDAAL